jgi:hypothetical protein
MAGETKVKPVRASAAFERERCLRTLTSLVVECDELGDERDEVCILEYAPYNVVKPVAHGISQQARCHG